MSDHDLDRLKDLPVPVAREAAKARALAAARQAFARGGDVAAVRDGSARAESNEYSVSTAQGVGEPVRQTNASSTTPRRIRMRSNHYVAMAASIAALCAAVPSLMYFSTPRPNEVAKAKPGEATTVVAALPEAAPVPVPVPVRAQLAPIATKDYPSQSGQQPVSSTPIGSEHSAYARSADARDLRERLRGEQAMPGSASAGQQAGGQQMAAAPAAPSEVAKAEGLRQEARLQAEQQRKHAESKRRADEARRVAEAASKKKSESSVDDGSALNNVRRPLVAGAPLAAPTVAGQLAVLAPPPPREPALSQHIDQGRDRFEAAPENPVKSVAAEPVSTFSIDVDTASYSFVRRSLNAGRLPPKDAVRVEEMINYFPYAYARPESAAEPFHANVQVFPSPWNANNQLVHIGLKGYDLKSAERPRANLVFLVDISGSMAPADRLPLLKNSFRMLLDNLQADDTVAIVTYANGSDVRLRPTKVANKSRIIAAIDSLNAGGSTHGAAGINDAYRVAEANFDKSAVNRVILATDGDWNVGITNRSELKSFIERKRETGIFLSILGVGMGNHNDALMQTLAQSGNGAAAYIDTLSEARKVLVDEASSTLFPIARDVKIQLEFNPARVSEYRLIGYESRMLKREDFNNDKVDAGDVGSGHSVTAIYEITPLGAPLIADGLRYQNSLPARGDSPAGNRPPRAEDSRTTDTKASEIGFLKLRYKLPKEEASRLATFVIGPEQTRRSIADASTEARFATAVAAFGQLLRGGTHLQRFGYDDVIALANGARGEDPFGYRAEFVNLARLAKSAAPIVGPR